MAKIFKFPGSGGAPKNPENREDKPEPEKTIETPLPEIIDIAYIESSGKKGSVTLDTRRFMQLADFAIKFMDNEGQAAHLKKEYAETISAYANGELLKWVTDSNQFQWHQKPQFFCAVLHEINVRGLVTKALDKFRNKNSVE